MPKYSNDTAYGPTSPYTVSTIMVRDISGTVRALTPHDKLPGCIAALFGSGGGGGGVPQSLSITQTAGTSPAHLSISGGNTVAINPAIVTTPLAPVQSAVGAVSTNVIGGTSATMGRPNAWYQIAGTNMVIPAFVGN